MRIDERKLEDLMDPVAIHHFWYHASSFQYSCPFLTIVSVAVHLVGEYNY